MARGAEDFKKVDLAVLVFPNNRLRGCAYHSHNDFDRQGLQKNRVRVPVNPETIDP